MSDPRPAFPPPFEHPYPVFVFHRPVRTRYWLHALLLLLTVFTTLVVGARLEHNFLLRNPAYSTDADFFPFLWVLADPSRLLLGIPFCATLLGILLAHEMGHYFLARRHRVAATLPFFLPAPTLIGTLGAFIRIRAPIPSRTALFDIGIAGPIAGFLVALPALGAGLAISGLIPAGTPPSEVQFSFPLVFHGMYRILEMAGMQLAPLASLYMHPVALAAWVGMFATALNLIPGGQLDGGHIVYALAPHAHRIISRVTVALLIPMGLLFWPGWLFWAGMLLFTGTRHPKVPVWPPLDPRRRLVAWSALVMLLLTFLPEPFPGSSLAEALFSK